MHPIINISFYTTFYLDIIINKQEERILKAQFGFINSVTSCSDACRKSGKNGGTPNVSNDNGQHRANLTFNKVKQCNDKYVKPLREYNHTKSVRNLNEIVILSELYRNVEMHDLNGHAVTHATQAPSWVSLSV